MADTTSESVSKHSGTTEDATAAAAAAGKPRGFVLDVVMNAFEPGVNRAVLVFLNAVFVLLLCTLATAAVFVGLNVHIVILSVLTLGLMVAFNWFLAQLHADEDGAVSTADNYARTRTKHE